MEKIIIPTAQFEAVYLVNGSFSQSGTVRTADNKVLYLTVLPLDATLLSYTVKIVGGNVNANREFCSIYTLNADTLIAVLRPRNNLVYTPQRPSIGNSPPMKLFEAIKMKKTDKARQLMTEELNAGIDDANLYSFFEEFSDIVPASAVEIGSDKYILCRKDGSASIYKFEYKQGLIDDINEN